MKIKMVAAAAAVVLSAVTAQAVAAGTWTVTATGTITAGTDYTGVFGTAGLSLAGLTYAQSITSSIDPALWGREEVTSYYNYVFSNGPGFTDTVTLNGHTVTFTATDTDNGRQFISNDASQGGAHGGADHVTTSQSAWLAGGGTLEVSNFVYSYDTAFVPTLNFGQTILQNTTGASFTTSASFTLTGTQHAEFLGKIDVISVNAVPEPEAYAMLLAGMGWVGFAARRKRMRS
ncbi:PEP-CTERM sorting domain-containing protein [Pseudoduganella sp. FT26W]|uniref:PEP-CTERM sorting domain-containing protein n=1 Tax=Duganella aquatilis TaxID=2666082 RepID=A0A844D396_9BURK|nr:PEP-CTERM sorting domain-containing protein [Duganella aquatilis]MRW82616.1 PEP-CTERM sorting domain-containing protein [Duganella aquatilis]